MDGTDAAQAVVTPAARYEALVVPGVERAVGHARRWLRDLVGADHPAFHDAAVCLCELLTNALRHTDSGRGGQMRVRLALAAEYIWAEVADDGCAATVPHLRPAAGESGRGLQIVDAYADAWGVEPRGAGHAVWFSISSC
jgi:anti-sigma regulatory factor (Ser/Thr protein kinase)